MIMHTYFKGNEKWHVGYWRIVYGGSSSSSDWMTVRECDHEYEAAWLAHYLNGGAGGPRDITFLDYRDQNAKSGS